MAQDHVKKQLSEYVLNLLPPAERQRVERHIKLCEQCQRDLQEEKQIERLLRSTLQKTTTSTPHRLRQFMPPIPQTTKASWGFSRWQKRLVPAFMVFLLLVSSLGLQIAFPIDSAPTFVNSVLAAEVTATKTPPAETAVLDINPLPQTQAQTETAASTLLSTGVATLPPATIATSPRPAPNPTPVVAVSELTAQ